MTILVSIASYRDPELARTIKSAIDNADSPDSLVFAVCLQEIKKQEPDLSWVPNLKLSSMDARYARGAGFARAEVMKLYDNEEYYLQVDSHTVFEPGWDTKCIEQLKLAQKISNNNKVILSYFPPPFYVERNNNIVFVKNSKKQPAYPTKQVPKLNKRKEWTAERVEFENSKRPLPELSSTVLAGFIFTTGDIVKEVPYDPEISFFGEEICFAVRAWTRGWDIYSPSITIVYHFYTREGYKKIWKDKNIRKYSWKEIEEISKEKQKKILCGIEQGVFGIGNTRSIDDYEKMVGINFKEYYQLTTEQKEDTIIQ